MTLAGASLTLFSGLYVLYREQGERPAVDQPEGKGDEQSQAGTGSL
jgi:hypothetical protein